MGLGCGCPSGGPVFAVAESNKKGTELQSSATRNIAASLNRVTYLVMSRISYAIALIIRVSPTRQRGPPSLARRANHNDPGALVSDRVLFAADPDRRKLLRRVPQQALQHVIAAPDIARIARTLSLRHFRVWGIAQIGPSRQIASFEAKLWQNCGKKPLGLSTYRHGLRVRADESVQRQAVQRSDCRSCPDLVGSGIVETLPWP